MPFAVARNATAFTPSAPQRRSRRTARHGSSPHSPFMCARQPSIARRAPAYFCRSAPPRARVPPFSLLHAPSPAPRPGAADDVAGSHRSGGSRRQPPAAVPRGRFESTRPLASSRGSQVASCGSASRMAELSSALKRPLVMPQTMIAQLQSAHCMLTDASPQRTGAKKTAELLRIRIEPG